jgi:hypothetical protein
MIAGTGACASAKTQKLFALASDRVRAPTYIYSHRTIALAFLHVRAVDKRVC